MQRKTWFVIADSARARILEEGESPKSDFIELMSLVHPESKLQEHELGDDRQGSFGTDRGGFRGANGFQHSQPEVDHKHRSAEQFAREVCGELEKARHEGRFKSLVLVAPPGFLGALRKECSVALGRMVEREVGHDYTRLSTRELQAHILEGAALKPQQH